MATQSVDLVILEISPECLTEAELTKHMRAQFPNTVIIVANGTGTGRWIARAFSYGAKDAFRKPYNRALIVERVKAILNRMYKG